MIHPSKYTTNCSKNSKPRIRFRLIGIHALSIILTFSLSVDEVTAQNSLKRDFQNSRIISRFDSILTQNYSKNDIDTTYLIRPKTKWTIRLRMNISGSDIKAEGYENDRRFVSKMSAERKGTISAGVSYLGFSLNMALNPAKILGKYHDFELNFNSYGKRFGFDFAYQDASNFTGWHKTGEAARIDLPADILTLKTLNFNTYYAFNYRRFSYPAAFSQNYIQKRSAGSFMLGASAQGQHGTINTEEKMDFKMTNIGIGGGYGYNYVPSQGWLLHISALPTLIIYSRTSMNIGGTRVPLHYHFPEIIITSRGAAVRQIGNKFFGVSMVFNTTSIGNTKSLAVENQKWHARAFFGIRL